VWSAIKGAIEKPGKEQVRVKRGKSLLIRECFLREHKIVCPEKLWEEMRVLPMMLWYYLTGEFLWVIG